MWYNKICNVYFTAALSRWTIEIRKKRVRYHTEILTAQFQWPHIKFVCELHTRARVVVYREIAVSHAYNSTHSNYYYVSVLTSINCVRGHYHFMTYASWIYICSACAHILFQNIFDMFYVDTLANHHNRQQRSRNYLNLFANIFQFTNIPTQMFGFSSLVSAKVWCSYLILFSTARKLCIMFV